MMNLHCLVLALTGLCALSPMLQAQVGSVPSTEILEVYDFRQVALADAMRLFSMQTGKKVVPSAEAGKIKISLFLTNVPPEVVLESIAKGHQLIVERDPETDVVSLMTRKEAEDEQKRSGSGMRGPARTLPGVKSPLQKMPVISVKGRVLEKNQPPVVMLEIGGKLMVITKNSVITLSNNLSFRVQEVTATQVQLMILPQNELMILP